MNTIIAMFQVKYCINLAYPPSLADSIYSLVHLGVNDGIAMAHYPLPPNGITVTVLELNIFPLLTSDMNMEDLDQAGRILRRVTAETVASLWRGLDFVIRDPNTAYYIIKDDYVDRADFPITLARRLITQYISQWATRYETYQLTAPVTHRADGLPIDLNMRQAVIDDLYTSLDQVTGGLGTINLYKGNQLLIGQRGILPEILVLTTEQFKELQDLLSASKLPADLYAAVPS
jgi:hypothetical protein